MLRAVMLTVLCSKEGLTLYEGLDTPQVNVYEPTFITAESPQFLVTLTVSPETISEVVTFTTTLSFLLYESYMNDSVP